MPVAFPGGLVQAQLLGQFCHGFGCGIRPHQHLGCVAGQYFKHQKHDDGRTQQCEQQREGALEEKKAHGRLSWLSVLKNNSEDSCLGMRCQHNAKNSGTPCMLTRKDASMAKAKAG
ncbi:hypothetical protein D3C72_2140530 [compost metagenome]